MFRLTQSASRRTPGEVKKIKLSEMKDDDWEPVIIIDDGKCFERAMKHHWNFSKSHPHVGFRRLVQKVAEEYGRNITNSICQLVIRHCPVCNIVFPRKENLTKNDIQDIGEVVFTTINVEEIEKSSEEEDKIEYADPKFGTYISVGMFAKNNFLTTVSSKQIYLLMLYKTCPAYSI